MIHFNVDEIRSNVKPGTADLRAEFVLFVGVYGCVICLWALYHFGKSRSEVEALRTPLLCLTWASSSIGMTVLNKMLVTTLEAPVLLSGFQMCVATVLVSLYTLGDLGMWRSVRTRQMLPWLVVPMFFAAMLCSGAYTYQYISLSCQTVVRNMAPLVVFPIEYAVMPAEKKPSISPPAMVAMILMIVGAGLYTSSAGSISAFGVFCAVANMLIAVGDRVTQRRLLSVECEGLPSLVCTILNNSVGMIPTFILACLTHEFEAAEKRSADWTNPQILVLLTLSGLQGIFICYFGIACQRAISATSFFVLQNGTKVFIVIIGVTLFGDPMDSYLIFGGLCLSFVGSLAYGKLQMDEKSSGEQACLVQQGKKLPA